MRGGSGAGASSESRQRYPHASDKKTFYCRVLCALRMSCGMTLTLVCGVTLTLFWCLSGSLCRYRGSGSAS